VDYFLDGSLVDIPASTGQNVDQDIILAGGIEKELGKARLASFSHS
jgi:hypothetical protein